MLITLFQRILNWLSRLKRNESSDQSHLPSDSLPDSQDSASHTTSLSNPNQLSAHFTLTEATRSAAAQSKGISNTPNAQELAAIRDTAQRMELVRALLGSRPIKINSWFRKPAVNAAVGGSKTSDHMSGRSVDFVCPAYGSPFEICQKIASSGIEFDQLIFETNSRGSQWVHIGFGSRMRGQVLTKKPNTGYLTGLTR